MATSEVQIVNLALSRVGETQFIASLNDATASARAAKVAWPLVLASAMEAHSWSWATRVKALAALAGEDVPGWKYAYAAPADCLHPRRVDESREVAEEQLLECRRPGVPFEQALSAAGSAKLLRCNTENAWLTYTRDSVPVSLWPSQFVDVLTWAMARELALSLPKKPAVGMNFEVKAMQALEVAKAHDRNTGTRRPPELSEFMKVRQ